MSEYMTNIINFLWKCAGCAIGPGLINVSFFSKCSIQVDAVIFAVYRGISLSVMLSKIPTKSDKEMGAAGLRANAIIGSGKGSHPQNKDEDGQSNGVYIRKCVILHIYLLNVLQ